MINIFVAFLISLSYHTGRIVYAPVLRFAKNILLVLPVVFLLLGAFQIINIFAYIQDSRNVSISNSSGKVQEVFVDSRTSIYSDVLLELSKQNAFLFGLGGVGRTETSLADITYNNFSEIYKEGRIATESGMLNFLQWGGIFSVLAYTFLFYRASSLALNYSRNWFCKALAVWIAYKFMFSFIDDVLIYNNNTLALMLSFGMCFNRKLRSKTDRDLTDMFNFIFSDRRISRIVRAPK